MISVDSHFESWGRDECCSPLNYCLGATCIQSPLSYGLYGTRSLNRKSSNADSQERLVFFFGPQVKQDWDKLPLDRTMNDSIRHFRRWATSQKLPAISAQYPNILACFNTNYLWCLVEPYPPPPFPSCGSNTSTGTLSEVKGWLILQRLQHW